MKIKRNKKFEKWAIGELKKIQHELLLDHFQPLTIEPNGKEHKSECQLTYPYQSIRIKYSHEVLEDFLKGNKEDAFNVLLHEMVHPLTDPLYVKATGRWSSKDEVEDEREKLTDHIANILLKNREKKTK